MEEEQRFQIFQENLQKIRYHNTRYETGHETYFLKVTQFADLKSEEFSQSLGSKMPTYFSPKKKVSSDVDLPYSVDWRNEGIFTDIKNSGTNCSSSWAFSAVSNSYLLMKCTKLHIIQKMNERILNWYG